MTTSNEFIQGVAWAIAELNRGHDEPTMCADIIKATGFELEDFEAASVAPYDLKEIQDVWANNIWGH